LRRRSRRGIVGIEAAIVMIAFVIVAAALAFVALNMGMTATQKAKQAIGSSLGEASSALMVDGDVIANVTSTGKVDALVIPLRLSSGKNPIDMSPNKTAIAVEVNGTYYPNVYKKGPYTSPTDLKTVYSSLEAGNPTGPNATVVFVINDGDNILEYGEKALVVVYLPSKSQIGPYDTIRVEIKPPQGAPLLVERTIPASLPTGGGEVSLG